jgi:AcrR family transcriptional regulator
VEVVDGRVDRAASERRRQSIIDAALECFTEAGYEATTVADIRRRAGVTTGSLYHYLPAGKAQIAAAVHVDCLRRYQDEFLPALAAAGADAETGVRAGVRFHLEWIMANRQRARFLFTDHPLEVDVAVRGPLDELNAPFFAAVSRWVERWISDSAIRRLPKQLLYALWVGPAHHVGRLVVAGQSSQARLQSTIDMLGDGAWRSLRADP